MLPKFILTAAWQSIGSSAVEGEAAQPQARPHTDFTHSPQMKEGVSVQRRSASQNPSVTRPTMGLRMKTTSNMHALGEQDFKSFAPEYSADSLPGTLDTPQRVIRRFNFGTSLRPIQARLPQISHFDVRMHNLSFGNQDSNQAETDRSSTVPAKTDYLRVYYSDFLSQPPICDVEKLRFADSGELTVESELLQNWILDSHPRSRTEAYPLYLLTKDVLRRISTNKCKIINHTLDKLRDELKVLKLAKDHLSAAAQEEIAALTQRIAALTQQLSEIKPGASPEDLERLAELQQSLAGVQKELDAAKKSAAKLEDAAVKVLSLPTLLVQKHKY
jgi:hypothetical protein